MANREKQDMTAELAEGKILPLVFKLTIPAVIAQLITFLYNIVDRMYVARIEGSGMDALAALGIVLPITLIMQAFANLVGLGGAPPSPTRFANACMISVMGSTIPSAASASMPEPSIRATYILSTILYKNVMSCAMTAGMVSLNTSGRIFPSASSAVISCFSLFAMPVPVLFCFQSVTL